MQTVKIMNSSDLTAAKFLIYLFISVDLLLLNLHNREASRKFHMQLEILSCLGYGPQSLNVKGFDVQAKVNAFYQLALLSNNLSLMSYQVVFT